MKKIHLVVVVLILGLFACPAFSQTVAYPLETLVVDRSTKNKAANEYAMMTRDAIQRVWKTPLNYNTDSALKGRVAITYQISRDGALNSVELTRSSGMKEMDESLVQAIRKAAPFPSFPQGIMAQNVVIRANFVVAEMPKVPLLTVDFKKGDSEESEAVAPVPAKKYLWGAPAGAALRKEPINEETYKEPAPEETKIPEPPSTKYKWGAN
ncbi:MAG: TonB family protein [Syntrophaceae bacterium]|nr:TonB family protein [Syntrophaceae bacterium]